MIRKERMGWYIERICKVLQHLPVTQANEIECRALWNNLQLSHEDIVTRYIDKEAEPKIPKAPECGKRNCKNCLQCHELEDKDTYYKVFCKQVGHWMEWNKEYNCTEFIPKEET